MLKIISVHHLKNRIMEYYTLKPQQPVGYLRQRALNTVIAVYHYIPPFQRWCMKICFGLEYEDTE